MLLSLHIENIALIKELNIDFGEGFTALTGETGAGKSILIDSLSFLLGNRVQRDLLRHDADSALVSALFGALSEKQTSTLASLQVQPDEDGTLLIERNMNRDGRTQCRINGRMVNLTLLREVASALIHIHGQSDTSLLTDRYYPLTTLDAYGTDKNLLLDYRHAYQEMRNAEIALQEHRALEAERLRLEETLRHQISEIQKVSPKADEEEKLFEKKNLLKNAERINKLASFSFRALKGSEKGSALVILEHVRQSLLQLQDIIPSIAELIDPIDSSIDALDSVAETVYTYIDADDADPTEQLNRIESRLDALYHLSKKYGGSIDACLDFLAKAKTELASLENFESKAKELEEKFKNAEVKVSELAFDIHNQRIESAKKMQAELKKTLQILDLPRIYISFDVLWATKEEKTMFNEYGADTVSFLFSSSETERPEELSKIASGGEISRVMLAIVDALAEKGGIGTTIYDEIDTGVSGKTARKIGIKMLHAAQSGQVLCVTHSAQIASLADTHFLIKKIESNGCLETHVSSINGEERVEEIARILGGIRITETQRAAAVEMLTNRNE